MVRKISMSDVAALSIEERVQLAQDIWDSLVLVPESVSLTEQQCVELDKRLETHRKSPEAAIPWAEVRDSIRKTR